MAGSGGSLTFGAEHRASESEHVPSYKPEAPQARHEIRTKLGQLVKLEEKYNSDARYEDRVLDLWSLMAGYVSLLEGIVPEPQTKAEFDADLSTCRGYIESIGKSKDAVPELPHVDVRTGDSEVPVYSIWFKDKQHTISVLEREFQFAFERAISGERERMFRELHQKALPDWSRIQAYASKWRVFGPETRVYSVEIANSLDRTLGAIHERRLRIHRDRVAAEIPPVVPAVSEPTA